MPNLFTSFNLTSRGNVCRVLGCSGCVNELERLRLSVEVRTGSEFDENSGTIKPLTLAKWLKRQARRWKEFGGPCDVRTWDQVRNAEKQQFRHPP
jgi:hypothetical protein